MKVLPNEDIVRVTLRLQNAADAAVRERAANEGRLAQFCHLDICDELTLTAGMTLIFLAQDSSSNSFTVYFEQVHPVTPISHPVSSRHSLSGYNCE